MNTECLVSWFSEWVPLSALLLLHAELPLPWATLSMGFRQVVFRHPIIHCKRHQPNKYKVLITVAHLKTKYWFGLGHTHSYWGSIYMVYITGRVLLEWYTLGIQEFLIADISNSPMYYDEWSMSASPALSELGSRCVQVRNTEKDVSSLYDMIQV